MKSISILFGSILLSIGFLATNVLAGPGEEHQHEEKAASEHGHDGGDEEGGHSGGHEEGGHSGGHMDHMSDVLQTLKQELGDKYDQTVPEATGEQLAIGKEVFTNSCVVCHGESGAGDGPASAAFQQKPADFTDPEHSKFYSDQGRIYIIKTGVKDTPMSAWESVLDEQEILAVHAYIRSLRSTPSKQEHEHTPHSH